jgi:hypothetical protein
MSMESDRVLSSLYREGAREEPPQGIDAAIAAAAADELGHAHAREPARSPPRWHVPFALAAVLVVAVSLHWLADPTEQEATSYPSAEPAAGTEVQSRERALSKRAEAPRDASQEAKRAQPSEDTAAAIPRAPEARSADSTAPAARTPLQSAAPERSARNSAESQRGASREPEKARLGAGSASEPPAPAATAALPAPPVSSPPDGPAEPHAALPKPAPRASDDVPVGKARADRAQAPAQRSEGGATSVAEEVDRGRASEQSTAMPGAQREGEPSALAGNKREQAPAAAAPTADRLQANPEQWLREIEELRRQGRSAEVRSELEAFRKRFPDYELPRALRTD